jgi:hypothetical protein
VARGAWCCWAATLTARVRTTALRLPDGTSPRRGRSRSPWSLTRRLRRA